MQCKRVKMNMRGFGLCACTQNLCLPTVFVYCYSYVYSVCVRLSQNFLAHKLFILLHIKCLNQLDHFFLPSDMTSAVSTVSAFQSPAEAKSNPQFGGPSASNLDHPQSSNNFFQPYQSPSFNPLVYLSYATPSTSNANAVTTNAQQTFNSTSVSQSSQSKSSAPFA